LDKPKASKVSSKDDKLFWAVIEIDVYIIRFTELERGGSLFPESKGRWDMSRICNSSYLYVPDHLYKAAKNQAYAIRRDQRQEKVLTR